MIAPSISSRRAFTLIELLVVISIIAILMTLLFPAVGRAIYQAKKVSARNDAVQIATAINAYSSEYGKLPTKETDDVNASDHTGDIMDVLSPTDSSNPPDLNPRAITFLEIPKAKNKKSGRVNNEGAYMDPWGEPYIISMDSNYDGVVKGPSGEDTSADIHKSVIVWSKADKNHPEDYTHPEKWIKSWE